MPERDQAFDDTLRGLFAAEPEPADDGFSQRVMRRIAGRTLRRRLLLAGAVTTGAVIAAWPLGQLLLPLSDGLRELVGQTAATDWLAERKTLLYGVALACLTPIVAAMLEE